MPYIKKEQRERIGCLNTYPRDAGELNYIISDICKVYLEAKGLQYQSINDVIGALEGAKQEFYRRWASPYEDKKIGENGDL